MKTWLKVLVGLTVLLVIWDHYNNPASQGPASPAQHEPTTRPPEYPAEYSQEEGAREEAIRDVQTVEMEENSTGLPADYSDPFRAERVTVPNCTDCWRVYRVILVEVQPSPGVSAPYPCIWIVNLSDRSRPLVTSVGRDNNWFFKSRILDQAEQRVREQVDRERKLMSLPPPLVWSDDHK